MKHLKDIIVESFFDDDIESGTTTPAMVYELLTHSDKEDVLMAINWLYEYVKKSGVKRITSKNKIEEGKCYIAFSKNFTKDCHVNIFTLTGQTISSHFTHVTGKVKLLSWPVDYRPFFRDLAPMRESEIYELTGELADAYNQLKIIKDSKKA
jgi:hypothetical protein